MAQMPVQVPVTQQAQSFNAGQHPGVQPVMYQPVPMGPPGQVMGPQVTQNQVSSNANVVINNAQRARRPWSSGLMGCCDDWGTCCSVLFCYPCMKCYLATQLEESCFVPILVPGDLLALRTKIRADQFIKGTMLKDCFIVSVCPLCAVCQMKREVDLIMKLRVQKRLNMVNQI